MSLDFCGKPIRGRSRFESTIQRRCFRETGHSGKCDEFPYLRHLDRCASRVAAKIKRDATKTTGASWKSENAGPNRIDRWGMMLSDRVLLKSFQFDISSLKAGIRAKLKEKAASYDDCMEVAAKLTWSTYQMRNAPESDDYARAYLEWRFKPFSKDSTRCIVCRGCLDFTDFEKARRGTALIETAHANPRIHNADNVGFAHRDCNIAQGGRSLDDFYLWIDGILKRVSEGVSAEVEAPGSHNSTSEPSD